MKKSICLLLSLLMVFTILPLTAHAADFTVTVVTEGQGTVRFEPENPKPGDNVTVYATAAEGWVIREFIFSDSEVKLSTITYTSGTWTEDFNEIEMPEDNLTVTVTFVPAGTEYTVSFDANDGTGRMDPASVRKDTPFEFPECDFERDGYTFVKWELDGAFYNPKDEIMLTDDTTAKAIWKKNGSDTVDIFSDNSVTTVIGMLKLTNTTTGSSDETIIYQEIGASSLDSPDTPSILTMIEEAKDELNTEAGYYSGLYNSSITISDPEVINTTSSETSTEFDDQYGKYTIRSGEACREWQYTITLTAEYTPAPMDYFSVWISDNEQNGNTGGGVVISYTLPDGSEPEEGTDFITSSINEAVPEGSQVTLTAEPYAYLGYRFVGWYQANINKVNPDDPNYLADKLISADKKYTFTGNPVGVGEAPYICAVFENTGIIREADQIQVWVDEGGKAAVEYTPSEPNTYEFEPMNGTDFVAIGEVVQYYKGDEITVYQQANGGYVFKGWYHVWIEWGPDSEHPKYEGEAISTDPIFTYKPGVTIIPGDTEPLRYVCAVFERASNVILGDADSDGDVTAVDAAWIARLSAMMDVPESFDEIVADVDGDGNVTVIDQTFIERYLAMMDTPFAIGEVMA